MVFGLRLRRLGTIALAALALTFAHPLPAHAYIYNPPYADIFGSQWNNLDTRQSAANFAANLVSSYHHFTDLNVTATIAMGTYYAQSDAIWVTFGHGGGGFISFCNPPLGSNCTSTLHVNSTQDPCSPTYDCLADYPTQIHRIRLMVFAGCETALTTGSGLNLPSYAYNTNGVDSTVGWDVMLYWPPADYWATRASIYWGIGDTISQGLYSAGQDAKNRNGGNAGGWDHYVVWNGGIKIVPAAYGS